jgi:biopolymer transport protein ExbD
MRNKNGAFGGQEEEASIDLTPMLDVVFIMLIFFIVTASFIKEAGIDVSRPTATTLDRIPEANILIAISPADEIWIDKKIVEPRFVKAQIERMHAENPKGAIVIQADEESTNEALTVVMEAAKQAGVANVAISTVDD